jgi:hypothetical protein
MRTTVTLDPDVEQLVKRAMRERGISFKAAVNDAIRSAEAGGGAAEPVDFPIHDMGEPLVDLTKSLRLAGELEDDELIRKLAQGR